MVINVLITTNVLSVTSRSRIHSEDYLRTMNIYVSPSLHLNCDDTKELRGLVEGHEYNWCIVTSLYLKTVLNSPSIVGQLVGMPCGIIIGTNKHKWRGHLVYRMQAFTQTDDKHIYQPPSQGADSHTTDPMHWMHQPRQPSPTPHRPRTWARAMVHTALNADFFSEYYTTVLFTLRLS